MSSQWQAVGAETDPRRRARKLQRSWERLLSDGALVREIPAAATAGLRPMIVESWRRSLETGLDPTDSLAPIEADESEVLDRWFEHPIGSLTHVLTEQLWKLAQESRSVVAVTDASGLVLHRMGEEWLKERCAEQNHLVEGARWSEAADGTNGIGTALLADHAFQVFASEHFNERHHQWICSGAPVHDPVSGKTIGLIDLSSLWKIAHPRSLELVTTAARTIEQRLSEVRRDQDARLRRRYGDLMTKSTDLLVNRDGHILAGAERERSKTLDVPEGGGEVVLGDGSVAAAASLGQGEAYLLRRVTARHARCAPVEVLERAELHVRELVTEQSALRQVATLVARESSPDQLFAVVAKQVARVFDVPHVRLVRYEPQGSVVVGGFEADCEPFPIGSRWSLDSPGVIATVWQTGRPARVEDYAELGGEVAAVFRAAGGHSTVASPIVVEGRLWGAMVVLSPRHEPFPESTEARLTDFTELVATAIANAESRAAVARLADEHAALQNVATLVAHGASPEDLFAAVAEEVGRLLPVGSATMGRYDPDNSVTTVASWSTDETAFPAGMRWPTDVTKIAWAVLQTGEASRIDDFSAATDPIGVAAREAGMKSAVGGPIVVEGHVWGLITVTSTEGSLPPDTEARLSSFTELVATAIANSEAREALAQLADEQAALRRVATLVASEVAPARIFPAVCEHVGHLLEADMTGILMFPGDGTATTIGFWSSQGPTVPVGTQQLLEPDSIASRILSTGAPTRRDSYAEVGREIGELADYLGQESTVGAPIRVGGGVWGALMAATRRGDPWAEEAESRLSAFTELVGTAIANAESRDALARLADEQAALRRVATLVARDVPPGEVFDAVAMEVGKLLDADVTVVGRYDPDGAATAIGSWGSAPGGVPVGTRSALGGRNVLTLVAETRRPARVDGYGDGSGEAAEIARQHGWRSSIAAPISVEGRLWGVMLVATKRSEPFPTGAEERLSAFTDLVATGIANAEGKSELAASRRRIVAAADEARRLIERDLHDGIQQRLIALTFRARAMTRRPPDELPDMAAELSENLKEVSDELREVSRGIHPTILTEAGLGPAVRALARRSEVPLDVDVRLDERLPAPVEAAAYYIASEALTNVAKHARANAVELIAAHDDGILVLEIRDDGIGGVDAACGSGILGLTDRVEALGGTIAIASPPFGGTTLSVRLPTTT
jgi:GAF domain-containing protein